MKKVQINLLDVKKQQMEFCYNKFIELESILNHMDSLINSEEYTKIYKLAFSYLDRYIDLYKEGFTDFNYTVKGNKGV